MRRYIPLILTLALTLSGCTGGTNDAAKTPEELTKAYEEAITSARDQELNDAYPIVTGADHPEAELVFQVLGVQETDMTAYAIAVSLRNVNAYAVAAIMPASGKEETVMAALEGYLETQQQNFERYLEDQYAIAKAAKLESQEDGTILLVMTEDQDKVLEAIQKSLDG